MATFVFVPGAGGVGLVLASRDCGTRSARTCGDAVDIREDDPALGLPEYEQLVERGHRRPTDVVLVAQSLGRVHRHRWSLPRSAVADDGTAQRDGPAPGRDAGGLVGRDRTGRGASGAALSRRDATRSSTRAGLPARRPRRRCGRGRGRTARARRTRRSASRASSSAGRRYRSRVIAGATTASFPRRSSGASLASDSGSDSIDEIRGGHLVALSNPGGLTDLLVSYL